MLFVQFVEANATHRNVSMYIGFLYIHYTFIYSSCTVVQFGKSYPSSVCDNMFPIFPRKVEQQVFDVF